MVGFESNISTNDKKKQKIIIITKGKSLHLQYQSTSQFLHTVRPKRKYQYKKSAIDSKTNFWQNCTNLAQRKH